MGEYRYFLKQTKKFFGGIMVVAFVLVIFDVMFLGYDAGIAFTGVSMQQKIERSIDEQVSHKSFILPEKGESLVSDVQSKVWEPGPLCFAFVMILSFGALLIFDITYQKGKTKEFVKTLPIRDRKWILCPFFIMLGVIVGSQLLETLFFLAIQTRYNHILADVIVKKGLGTVASEFVSVANKELIVTMLSYTMILVAGFIWLYFWMLVTRYKLLGGVLAVGIASFIQNIVDTIYWELYVDSLAGLENGSDIWYRSVYGTLCAVCIVIGSLLIVFLAGRVELSKGRIFYFTSVDIVVCMLAAVAFFAGQSFDYLFESSGLIVTRMVMGVGSSIIVAFLLFFLLHPIPWKAGKHNRMTGEKKRIRIVHSHKREEFLRLFRLEWKENLFFLLGNCMYMALMGADYLWPLTLNNGFLQEWGMKGIHLGDGAQLVQETNEVFGFCAEQLFFWCFGTVVSTQLVWLLFRKAVQTYKERNRYGREFVMGLPVQRSTQYLYTTCKDCFLLLAPIIIHMIGIAVQFDCSLSAANLNMSWWGISMTGICLVCCAYLLMAYSLMRWIEMLVANGLLRTIAEGGVLCIAGCLLDRIRKSGRIGRSIYCILGLAGPGGGIVNEKGDTEYQILQPLYTFWADTTGKWEVSTNYDIWADESFSRLYAFTHPSSYMGYVCIYLAIAGIFLYFAWRLMKQQEWSVDGLYFPFAKYVFAGLIALFTFALLIENAIAWWHRILIGTVTIVTFVAIVYYLEPNKKSKKVGVVK